jgi:cell division septation protein DedD
VADRDFAQLQATVKPDAPGPAGVTGLRSALLVLGILSVVIMAFVGGYWLGSRQGHDAAQAAARARLQAQLEAQQKELQALRQQAKKDQAKAPSDNSPTMEVGDLTFYTDLPKQSVKPQPLAQPLTSPDMPSPPPPASPASPPASSTASSSAPSPAPAPKPAPAPAPPAATGSAKMVQSIIQRELNRTPAPAQPAGGGAYYVQVAAFRNAKDAAGIRQRLQGAGFASRVRRVDLPDRGTWYRLQVGPYASRAAADAARAELASKQHQNGIVVRDGG